MTCECNCGSHGGAVLVRVIVSGRYQVCEYCYRLLELNMAARQPPYPAAGTHLDQTGTLSHPPVRHVPFDDDFARDAG